MFLIDCICKNLGVGDNIVGVGGGAIRCFKWIQGHSPPGNVQKLISFLTNKIHLTVDDKYKTS